MIAQAVGKLGFAVILHPRHSAHLSFRAPPPSCTTRSWPPLATRQYKGVLPPQHAAETCAHHMRPALASPPPAPRWRPCALASSRACHWQPGSASQLRRARARRGSCVGCRCRPLHGQGGARGLGQPSAGTAAPLRRAPRSAAVRARAPRMLHGTEAETQTCPALSKRHRQRAGAEWLRSRRPSLRGASSLLPRQLLPSPSLNAANWKSVLNVFALLDVALFLPLAVHLPRGFPCESCSISLTLASSTCFRGSHMHLGQRSVMGEGMGCRLCTTPVLPAAIFERTL